MGNTGMEICSASLVIKDSQLKISFIGLATFRKMIIANIDEVLRKLGVSTGIIFPMGIRQPGLKLEMYLLYDQRQINGLWNLRCQHFFWGEGVFYKKILKCE